MTRRGRIRAILLSLTIVVTVGLVVVVSLSYAAIRESIHRAERQIDEARTSWARASTYISVAAHGMILSDEQVSEVANSIVRVSALTQVRSLHFLGPDYSDVGAALLEIERDSRRIARSLASGMISFGSEDAAQRVDRALGVVSAEFGRYTTIQEQYVSHLSLFVLAISSIVMILFVRIERKNRYLRLSEDKAREMSRFLLSDYERKMHSVALELHDDIAQELYLALAADGESEAVSGHLNAALAKVRALAHGVRPGEVAALTLRGSLQALCREFAGSTPIDVTFSSEGLDSYQPAYEVRIQIYRIVQECLTNAARHSDAGRIAVELHKTEKELIVGVQDNGRGFRFEEDQRHALAGLGIKGMYDRAAILGGTIAIHTRPDEGTRVELRLGVSPAKGSRSETE